MNDNCRACGEPGATYPSLGGSGNMICNDAIACLERLEASVRQARETEGTTAPEGKGWADD